jgi:ATP-dependent DNA ligase
LATDQRSTLLLLTNGFRENYLMAGFRHCCDVIFLYAFDLLDLNGTDLRREPIEVRKATLASILRKSQPGVRLDEHMERTEGAVVSSTPARWGWRGSSRSTWDRATVRPLAVLAEV